MRIYILSDNKVVENRPKDLLAEWGFAALMEINNRILLFDAGKKVVDHNAQSLGAPLDRIEKIVVSHGHYDHTTGLMDVLGVSNPQLYLHPHAWLPRYIEDEYIGMPHRKEEIESLAKVIEHNDPVEVIKKVWALGEIPREHESGKLDSYIIKDGKKVKDKVLDDQALAIKTEEGIVLLLGCCHAGLRNTVDHVEETVGDEVKYVIGGTHFISLKNDEIKKEGEWLDKKVDLVAPCHCTGFRAESLLSSILGDKFRSVGAGSIVEL